MKNKLCVESDYTDKLIPIANSDSTVIENQESTKYHEGRTVLMVTFLFFPLASVALVGTYGFIMWFSQSLLT